MGNLGGKKLHKLFHDYLDRKSRESVRSHTPYYCGVGANSGTFYGVIYFYEWSDVTRAPRKFFTIDMFDRFLKESGIYMALYEKDILRNLKWSYVTCKKGKKELIIRQSWQKLNDALCLHNELSNAEEASDRAKELHSIGFTSSNPPLERGEPNGRWFG